MMEKMQNKMMKRYQMFAWLGLIIVLVSFWLAYSVASPANAAFFSVAKATREAAGTGTALALANVARHSIAAWVPHFKFLGLGLMLGAITMALGLIATTLRNLGKDVMATWPAELNPGVPDKPKAAKMFPMMMMMGWILLFAALIWALVLNGTVTLILEPLDRDRAQSGCGRFGPAEPVGADRRHVALVGLPAVPGDGFPVHRDYRGSDGHHPHPTVPGEDAREVRRSPLRRNRLSRLRWLPLPLPYLAPLSFGGGAFLIPGYQEDERGIATC